MSLKIEIQQILNSTIVIIISKCRTYASPAPKANEDLAKAKFYTEIVKAKNASALGVRVHAIVMPDLTLNYSSLYGNNLLKNRKSYYLPPQLSKYEFPAQ